MLVHTLSLLVIFLKFFVFNSEETQDVSDILPGEGVPIEVGVEDDLPYIDQNITEIFINGRTLKQYETYQDILREIKNEKGIILSTKEYILTNSTDYDPDFIFIPIKNTEIKFVLYELDAYDFAVGIKSNQSLSSIRFNKDSQIDYFFKKAELIENQENYLIYKIDKFNLETNASKGIILNQLDLNEIKIENDYKDLNFKDEFIWKKGETKLLSDF